MSEENNGGNGINPNSVSIIVTKGSLDWAYPPFILSTTAAAIRKFEGQTRKAKTGKVTPALLRKLAGLSN